MSDTKRTNSLTSTTTTGSATAKAVKTSADSGGKENEVLMGLMKTEMTKAKSVNKYCVVGGIDLGAAGTGLSLGFRSPDQKSVSQITTFPPLPTALKPNELMDLKHPWRTQTGKVPTKVALDAVTLELLEFGDGVEKLWSKDLAAARSAKKSEKTYAPKILIFDNIKAVMDFANNTAKQTARDQLKSLRDAVTVSDRRDIPVPLIKLLTNIFKHCKQSVLAKLPQSTNNIAIRWVICLPACWDDAAKQFLREAAELAGLCKPQSSNVNGELGLTDDVVLALESEAAVITWHHHVLESQKSTFKSNNHNNSVQTSLVQASLTKVPISAEVRQRYLKPGSKCLSADAGGHTFDCTLHEVDLESGKLTKASHSAGAWGGRLWDAEFAKMLDHSFGGDWMGLYAFEYPDDAFELAQNIEKLKKEIDPQKSDNEEYRLELPHSFISHTNLSNNGSHGQKLTITLNTDPTGSRNFSSPAEPTKPTPKLTTTSVTPTAIDTCNGKKEDDDEDDTEWDAETKNLPLPDKLKVQVCGESDPLPEHGKRLCYQHGALLVSQQLALSMFDEPLTGIKQHIEKLIKSTPTLSTVVLAGGFCQSLVVRSAIETIIRNVNQSRKQQKQQKQDTKTDSLEEGEILVMTVEDPTTAVLVGASLYGLDEDIIRDRVMRNALGTNIAVPWDPTHKIANGCFRRPRDYFDPKSESLVCDDLCYNHFKRFVNVGDVVGINEAYTHVFGPCQSGQREMIFNLYSTTNPKVDRVTQLPLVGQIVVPMFGNGGIHRQITLLLKYGGTAIQAHAFDPTSNTHIQAHFKFLD